MNHSKAVLALGMVLIGFLLSGSALAHNRGGHVRFGLYIGAPVFPPRYYPVPSYYPAPYYYAPPVMVAPAAPPVYIEQGTPQAAPAPANYWYYCADAEAYYPYVKQCPGGWQRVSPQPPAQ